MNISPNFGLDKPTSLIPKEQTIDDTLEDDFQPVSPTWGPDEPPSPTSESGEIASPRQKTTQEAVDEAISRYYLLKGKYDKKYKNAKKKVVESVGRNNLEKIKKKLKSLRLGCVNCKQNGGTVFTNNSRLLTAKCGNTETPCDLDIQIQQGKWMLLSTAMQMSQEGLDDIKANIIDLKLDLLFGLRTEEQITSQFNEDKANYKSQTKQLHLLNDIIESENKIRLDDNELDTPKKIHIKQYLEIKNIQLKKHISQFKEFINDYMAEVEDPQLSMPFLNQAVVLYIEQIFPLMAKIRESKYAVTMMDDTEEQGLFIMKKIKTLLKNLEFEYEFGQIISDKK